MDINILINTFEELKKYVFMIKRGKDKDIIIRFTNDKFYHLIGLHKINLDQFFPSNMNSKDKRYKYIKKNPDKFNNIIKNQFRRKESLELRIKTFPNILDLLRGNSSTLYNLQVKTKESMYDGDYAIVKTYEADICCLLGLKTSNIEENFINCIPNSWMSSNRINKLVEFKRPKYMDCIIAIPIEIFDENSNF